MKWTPCWTMPKTRRCLWWNGLWLRWGTATPRRSDSIHKPPRNDLLRNRATFSVVTEANKKLFWLSIRGRTFNEYSQGPDGAEQVPLAARRGGKRGKHHNLGSERRGEHLRYITQPWFPDDLGVVGPEFQANRVDGKGPQVSLDRRQC